jgi:CHAT domain-containing protein/tetratricopeptide (TPR) repeat protein
MMTEPHSDSSADKSDIRQLWETLRDFLRPNTPENSKAILQEHPELLSEKVDQMLHLLATQVDDPRDAARVEERRAFLKYCRRTGFDVALVAFGCAERGQEPAPGVRPLPVDLAVEMNELISLENQAQHNPSLHLRCVEHIRSMLPRVDQGRYPSSRAALLNDLGTAYVGLPTGDRQANLLQAIACFQQALACCPPDIVPLHYAALQNSLGSVYEALSSGDQTSNLLQAIACYRQALTVCTSEVHPDRYAQVHANLGRAFHSLPTGDLQANLEQAIAHYQEALEFYTLENAPWKYAAIQYALGGAYAQLPRRDRLLHPQKAIACYQEALRVWTLESAPEKYAMIQNDLGNVYFALTGRNEREALRQAVICMREALRVFNPTHSPERYAMAQSNLGAALIRLVGLDPTQDPQEGIRCCQNALTVYTIEAFAMNYAKVQNDLGMLYRHLNDGPVVAHLQQALRCHMEALRVYTQESTPLDYAMTYNNLGMVYADLATWGEARKDQALESYARALDVCQDGTVPVFERAPAMNLGNLHFKEGEWQAAHAAYARAIAAGERLYRMSATEPSRQAELADVTHLSQEDAYCLAKLGRLPEAVERLETGRTRTLVEALTRNSAALELAREDDRAAFEQARATIQELDAQVREMVSPLSYDHPRQPYVDLASALQVARTELFAVIERIRAYVPNFMPNELDARRICQASAAEFPLVYLVATSKGGMALLASHALLDGAEECVIWLEGMSEHAMNSMVPYRGRSTHLVEVMTQGNRQEIMGALDIALPSLGQSLMEPLAERLRLLGYSGCTLVPCGCLGLLPLHAALLENGQYTDETLEIGYAASARHLQLARRSRPGPLSPHLCAIADPPHLASTNLEGILVQLPLPRLRFSELEVEAVSSLFPGEVTLLKGESATRAAVLSALSRSSHIHLSCHAVFRPDEPLASGLALAGSDWLTVADALGRLDLSGVELVALCACQTAMSDTHYVPDEIVGLPAGFLQAGVKGVVSTLWPVADAPTAILLRRFYQLHLVHGLRPTMALRQAQQWLRQSTVRDLELVGWYERLGERTGQTDALRMRTYYQEHPDEKPFAHPYYWAAFTFTGVGSREQAL